jgi:putative lysine transport system substrate-binding protein
MVKRSISVIILLQAVLLLAAACSQVSKSDASLSAEEPASEQPAADEQGSTAVPESTPEENIFRVGMEAGYAPFNWTQLGGSNGGVAIDGNMEYAGGYDVEIAKRIAEGLGKKLVIVKTEWDGLVPALISGKIDAIVAGMSPTAERKEAIDFSDN